MKGDYSRIPFDERKKMQHYRKVYHQQGKVLLDSDLNENTDLLHYQMKTLVKDGLCGSPNIGFRIGRGVPLLPVDDHRYIGKEKGWSCTNNGTLTVDYFEKFEGKGSLKLENAEEVSFTFQKPVDLSKYRYLNLALRLTPSNNKFPGVICFDSTNETEIYLDRLPTSDQNEYSVINYVFPLDAVLDNITKVIFEIEKNTIYHIGAVECSSPMFTLEPMTHLKGWNFDTDTPESAEISIDGEVINVSQITRLYKRHFSTVDFSKFETMEFAIESSSASAIEFYVSDENDNTSYWEIINPVSDLNKYFIIISQKTNDSDTPAVLASIKEYGFRKLSVNATYTIGSILYKMSLENNFVISGTDPLSGETGRLYVDGELYEKEVAETYLNQKDCPWAPSITQGKRTDMVYVDVWQRHVTSAEDPELREVAVGVDTCNRMKAVAQVKVLEGSTSLPYDLKPTGSGRLSTSVEYMEAEKLCEITPGVEYTGLENRLYRVETHTPGEVGSATYKWSGNNGSTVLQIIENVKMGDASVRVKDVKPFEKDDIIEITDDRVEFADRKYINNQSSIRPCGELRRITSIDRIKNELIWDDDDTAPDDPLSMTGGLPHDYTAEGEETTHPRVIKWDGAKPTSNEETLEDGITIRFSGSDMLPGDYWTFTARENTRTVERLVNEPPQGVVHRYYPLATIEWDENGEIVNVTDLRTRFEPLCGLTAADLAFDNANTSDWTDAENVQQALEDQTFPNASGIQFNSSECNFLYGDNDNVQDALDNLCNGITVPSLTLKGKDGDQDNWPKLECSDERNLVEINKGLHIVTGELEAPFFKAGQGNKAFVTKVGWYRIAENKADLKRSNAEFTLRDYNKSGEGNSTLTFRIGISYNDHEGMSFTVLNHSRYSYTTFTRIRILKKGISDTQYLEVFVNLGGWVDYSIYDNLQKDSWKPVNWEEVSAIPEGYDDIEFDVDNLFVVGDYENRFIVERGGNVGIGTPEPKNKLDVEAGAVIGSMYSGTQIAPVNGLLVQGKVGIGTPVPKNKLDVEGGAVIGTGYSGTQIAPVNGLLVQGNVGIGTENTNFGRLTIQDSAVSLAFRETGIAVDQGGLWRMLLDNSSLRFDVNTGAQDSEFGENYITPLKITKDGEVIVTGELKAPFFKAGQGNSASVNEGIWYRIAEIRESRVANAEFTLRDEISYGEYSFLTFRIGISYFDARSISFTVLNHSRSYKTTFKKIRVLQKSNNDNQYLEVFVNKTRRVNYSIYDNLHGWEPVNWEEGVIPFGYSVREFDVDNLFVVGDYENRFTIKRGGNVGIGTDNPKSSLHIKVNDLGMFPLVTENYTSEITPEIISNFFESLSTNSVILGIPQGDELTFFWNAIVNNKITIFHGKLTGQEIE